MEFNLDVNTVPASRQNNILLGELSLALANASLLQHGSCTNPTPQLISADNMSARKYDVDLLMQSIEHEVLYRRDRVPSAGVGSSSEYANFKTDKAIADPPASDCAIIPPEPIHLNLPERDRSSAETSFPGNAGASYRLNDLLRYDDIEFVHAAFWAILKRVVDDDGLKSYLRMLRDGASKVEILGRLRESPEGTLRGAHVDGLHLSYVFDSISRWPVIGKLIGIAAAVWNLPNAQRNQRRMSNDFACRLQTTHNRITNVTNTVYAALETLENTQNIHSTLSRDFATRTGLEAIRNSITETTAALGALGARLSTLVDKGHFNQELGSIQAQIGTKAEHASVTALNQHVQSIAQFKADRRELSELIAALTEMQSLKANCDDFAAVQVTISKIMESITALKISKANSEDMKSASRLWNERLNEMAVTKADDGALRTVRMEGRAALNATKISIERMRGQWSEKLGEVATSVRDGQRALKAVREEGSAAILGIAQKKADQGGLDTLRQETMSAIDSARLQWSEWLDQITSVKADLNELRETGEKVNASLIASTDLSMEAIRGIAQSKADRSGLDAVRQETMSAIDSAHIQCSERLNQIASVNNLGELYEMQEKIGASLIASTAQSMEAIHEVAQSKADQSGLDALRRAIETQMNDAIGEVARDAECARLKLADDTKLEIETLNRTKADQASIAELKADSEGAMNRTSERLMEALRPVILRAADLKQNVLNQERRIGLLLEEARKRFPKPISTEQIGAMLAEEDHHLDAMYASFEDQFRGTRADIRQRQSIYLQYVRQAKAGSTGAPVLDLGCGRGEWLELLGSEGLVAQGVERNKVFLAQCRELNLEVNDYDAVTYLRQLKPNSIGAVTAFHLIEHLAHRHLVALIDEVLRVLMPGGIVIFETPNPRNLIVAGCNFYLDPTHRHPLPPDLSRYLLEARGFCKVELKEIHPFGSEHQIVDGDTDVKDTLNKYLFSAQDYAVIGQKA